MKYNFVKMASLIVVLCALISGAGVWWYLDWPSEQKEMISVAIVGSNVYPISGAVPLTVKFVFYQSAEQIDFGDGSYGKIKMEGGCGPTESCPAPNYYATHTFILPGIYTVVLKKGGETIGDVVVTVLENERAVDAKPRSPPNGLPAGEPGRDLVLDQSKPEHMQFSVTLNKRDKNPIGIIPVSELQGEKVITTLFSTTSPLVGNSFYEHDGIYYFTVYFPRSSVFGDFYPAHLYSYDSRRDEIALRLSSIETSPQFWDFGIIPPQAHKWIDLLGGEARGMYFLQSYGCTNCHGNPANLILYNFNAPVGASAHERFRELRDLALFEWTGKTTFRYKTYPKGDEPQAEMRSRWELGVFCGGVSGCYQEFYDWKQVPWTEDSF